MKSGRMQGDGLRGVLQITKVFLFFSGSLNHPQDKQNHPQAHFTDKKMEVLRLRDFARPPSQYRAELVLTRNPAPTPF